MKNTIYIYSGNGASPTSVVRAKETLARLVPDYAVRDLDAESLLRGDWRKDAALLVFSGGETKIWRKELGRRGQDIIRNAVRDGLSYIGFCAGGYFAASQTIFDNRSDEPEYLNPFGLGFFNGLAIGPVWGKYSYKSRRHARAARTLWRDSGAVFPLYYNGGCYFEPRAGESWPSNVTVLATYVDFESKAAALGIRYGKGRIILWGMHPEFSCTSHDATDIHIRDFLPQLTQAEPMRISVMDDSLTYLGLKTIQQPKVA